MFKRFLAWIRSTINVTKSVPVESEPPVDVYEDATSKLIGHLNSELALLKTLYLSNGNENSDSLSIHIDLYDTRVIRCNSSRRGALKFDPMYPSSMDYFLTTLRGMDEGSHSDVKCAVYYMYGDNAIHINRYSFVGSLARTKGTVDYFASEDTDSIETVYRELSNHMKFVTLLDSITEQYPNANKLAISECTTAFILRRLESRASLHFGLRDFIDYDYQLKMNDVDGYPNTFYNDCLKAHTHGSQITFYINHENTTEEIVALITEINEHIDSMMKSEIKLIQDRVKFIYIVKFNNGKTQVIYASDSKSSDMKLTYVDAFTGMQYAIMLSNVSNIVKDDLSRKPSTLLPKSHISVLEAKPIEILGTSSGR